MLNCEYRAQGLLIAIRVFHFTVIVSQKTDPELKTMKHRDFLDILLLARGENGKGLTDLEIREEVDNFVFAGIWMHLSACYGNSLSHEKVYCIKP